MHDRILDRKVLEAVEAGDEEALATAFAAGASANARTHASADSLSGAGILPCTALSLAASRGDITMVNVYVCHSNHFLSKIMGSFNTVDFVMCLYCIGMTQQVQALLKAGADINDRIWDPSNAR